MKLLKLDTKGPLRGRAAVQAVTKEREFIEQRVGVPIHKFTDYNSFLQAGCKNVWATFRACHLTANIFLSTKFKVISEDADDPITGTPLNRIIETPNRFDSWEEILYMWIYHMKLTGNAYWLKDELDGDNRPRAIYPLLPHLVKVVPHRTEKVSKYLYKINGEELEFSPEEIIHFKRPHPMNLHFGMGDIEPSQTLFNNFINRGSYEEAFLKHGAMPSGIMTYKGSEETPATLDDMGEDEWGKVKDWWQIEYGGRQNAGKTAFVTGEWEYTRLGLTQQEMSSIENEKWTIEQIFTNHGIPLSIAGIQKAANYATARQDEINFRRFEIVPMLDVLVGKLNGEKEFAKLFDERVTVAYELSGLIDVEQVWKDYEGLIKNGGMTMNEIRQRMGLQSVADPMLDQYFVDQNRMPLDSAGIVPPDEIELRMIQAGLPVAADYETRGHSCITHNDEAHKALSENKKYYDDEEKQVTAAIRAGLKKKVEDHNEKVGEDKTKRTSLRTLIAVFERGVGAYNTNPGSVRPTVTSAEQWGYARVNSFLYALRNGRFRSGRHDTDLLPEGHPQSSKYYHDEEDEDKELPDGYRPATNDDVPEGRACGNCAYFNEDDVAADGRARCEYWNEYVEGGYYCDAWKTNEDQKDRKDEVQRRKPPKDAISSYRDGVKRHENGETGDGIEPITIRMAKDFISGAMPTDQWTAKANRWWGRNERFLDEEKGSAAYAAAQLWGGRAGLRYWKAEATRRGLVG